MQTPRKPKGGYSFSVPTRVQDHDKNLLCHAYSIILGCSAIEDLQLDIFVHILGGKTSVAAAAYLALSTRGPKLAALVAAAKVALDAELNDALAQINARIRKILALRDELAHSVLVTPDTPIKDTLLFRNVQKGRKSAGDLRKITLTEMEISTVKIEKIATALHCFAKITIPANKILDLPEDRPSLIQRIGRELASVDKLSGHN